MADSPAPGPVYYKPVPPPPAYKPAPAPVYKPAPPPPAYKPAPAPAYKEPEHYGPVSYKYGYEVKDDYAGVNFGANEAREGKSKATYIV